MAVKGAGETRPWQSGARQNAIALPSLHQNHRVASVTARERSMLAESPDKCPHLALEQIGPEASLRLHDVVAQPLFLPHDGGGPLHLPRKLLRGHRGPRFGAQQRLQTQSAGAHVRAPSYCPTSSSHTLGISSPCSTTCYSASERPVVRPAT